MSKLDDELGSRVIGGCLAGENLYSRCPVGLRLLPNSLVQGEGFENVQELPLVFMNALDMNVENRRRIDFHAGQGLHQRCKPQLVIVSDFRKALYKEIGDPNTDLENLRAVSPLFHADKIVKPLIVLQGVNDPRVIKPESDEIVENIKKRNGVVEYVLFDNEGHGFTKRANEIRAYKAILDFLDRYLKAAEVSTN